MKTYSIIILTLFVFACKNNNTEKQIVQQPNAPLQKDENSSAFNQSFKNLLNAYIAVKDDFVNENKSRIDSSTKLLIVALDGLKIDELKADSIIIRDANVITQLMLAVSNNLLEEKDLLNKRISFQRISDLLYSLVMMVQYNQAVIYHYQCTDAFKEGDKNGTWLSLSMQKNNPYQPSNASCVTLLDSLNFK